MALVYLSDYECMNMNIVEPYMVNSFMSSGPPINNEIHY